MNYIYDIYLNLNSTLYDFFDWNKSDKLIHVKKIPIFKVNEETLKMCINNYIKISLDFLSDIYNKTELWNEANYIQYCALFMSQNTVIAIEFDNNGYSIKKSFLAVEEELEILETKNRLKEQNIAIEVKKINTTLLKTRKQIKDENFINNELKNISFDKLNYIYFECFGKQEKNKNTIYNNIKNLSKNSKAYKNLYDILKLTSTSKNKMI